MQKIQVIDSHTGGEPTRIIFAGGPDLGTGSLAERQQKFRDQHDQIRRAAIHEPRGSDWLVGGLICPPVDPTCDAGVIFFNNSGYLGMCGHGMIGLVVTLAHLNRISIGQHRIETSVGVVTAELKPNNEVSVRNVPSYRFRKDVSVEVPGYGTVVGDIAWGGNWFFLVKNTKEILAVQNSTYLTTVCLKIRDGLKSMGIAAPEDVWIDHIELFGCPVDPKNNSRNFVLCPGGAYDRSPCGTGTSAKLACLAADNELQPGEFWRQESIVGSVFQASYENGSNGQVIATITGSAHVCAESTLLLDPQDPFCLGIC